MEPAKTIDLHISDYMRQENMTVQQMADELSMTANSLRWKRSGKQDWKWSEILKLAELTGKTPDELSGIKN